MSWPVESEHFDTNLDRKVTGWDCHLLNCFGLCSEPTPPPTPTAPTPRPRPCPHSCPHPAHDHAPPYPTRIRWRHLHCVTCLVTRGGLNMRGWFPSVPCVLPKYGGGGSGVRRGGDSLEVGGSQFYRISHSLRTNLCLVALKQGQTGSPQSRSPGRSARSTPEVT